LVAGLAKDHVDAFVLQADPSRTALQSLQARRARAAAVHPPPHYEGKRLPAMSMLAIDRQTREHISAELGTADDGGIHPCVACTSLCDSIPLVVLLFLTLLLLGGTSVDVHHARIHHFISQAPASQPCAPRLCFRSLLCPRRARARHSCAKRHCLTRVREFEVQHDEHRLRLAPHQVPPLHVKDSGRLSDDEHDSEDPMHHAMRSAIKNVVCQKRCRARRLWIRENDTHVLLRKAPVHSDCVNPINRHDIQSWDVQDIVTLDHPKTCRKQKTGTLEENNFWQKHFENDPAANFESETQIENY
jgi:hypothetical protein